MRKINFKLAFTKMFNIIKLPFLYIWKGFNKILSGLSRVIKYIFRNIKYILVTLLFIILLILPIITILVLFKLEKFSDADWGNIVGGCLGYYGTVILGIVATLQTNKSLKQSDKNFLTEKYSYIKFLNFFYLNKFDGNEGLVNFSSNNPVNFYLVSKDTNTLFDKETEFVCLKFFYFERQSPINKINILDFKINEEKFYVNKYVMTDVVEIPQNDNESICSIEIIMFGKNIASELQNLYNKNNLLVNIELEILSGFGVNTKEKVCLNLYDAENRKINIEHEYRFGYNVKRKIDNISYNYDNFKKRRRYDSKRSGR